MKSIRKKILVWMLLVAMLPQSLFTLVAEAAQEVMRQKPDVEVRWLPVRDEILVGEEGAIVLEASLNKYQEKIQSADVEIRLEPQEVEALQEFRDGRGYLDEEEELYSDRGDIPISLSMDGDGGGILRFSLDLGRRSLRQRFHFMIPADSEELYNIEVTEEDIEVILMETEVTSREEEKPLQAEDKEQVTGTATPGDATPGQANMAFGKRAGISKKSWSLLAAPLEKATDSGAQSEPPFATPSISVPKDQKSESDEGETEEIPVYVLKEAETLYIKGTFDWSLKLEEESRMDQFSFTVEAEPEGEEGSLLTGSQALRLRVLLPEWLCLPEGEYFFEPENHQIMGGPWAVARLEGIPEGGQIVDVYPEDANTLSFSMIRLQEGKTEEELEGLKLSMTLFGENLVMKDAKAEAARGIGEGLTAEEAAERTVIRESSFKEFSEEESEGIRIGTPYKALMEKDEQARVLSGPGVSKDHREGEIKVSAHLISVPMAGAERASLRTARESVQVRAEDLLRSEIKEVVIDYGEAMEQNIFWADNLDEDGERPGKDDFTAGCALYYKKKLVREGTVSVAGPDWSEIEENLLTEETWQEVGLDSKPSISYNGYGGNGLLSVQKLPSQITETDIYNNSKTYEIQWILKLPACEEDYALTEVTQEDINNGTVSVGTPGWYYVRKTDFKFHIQWFMGGEELTDEMRHRAWEQLQLNIQYENGNSWQEGDTNLADLIENGNVGFAPSEDGADFTLKGIWKYNLDGSPISYWISEEEDGGSADGKMDMEGTAFDEGDYLTVAYNNAGASENQNAENGVYNGGTIRLTRTGTKDYEATKKWLDEGDEAAAQRPDGVYEIWRYRAGESYNTAAPYRADGQIVTIKFSTEDPYMLNCNNLPKYDAEGYEYLYVVREYLNPETPEGKPAASYEQVFGSISESGKVTDRVDNGKGHLSDTATREENNTFLYNGGTLSNRITGTVPTEVTKIWRAAAFQADFENVAVELTLYGRILGDEDGEWKAVKTADGRLVTTLMDDFTAENLTIRTYNASMPRYDALGRELEYMWQETAVYQADEQGNLGGNLLDSGRFTLEQGGRTVTYRSEATVSDADGTFATTVENSIADEIRYDLEKIWINEDGEPIDGPSEESGIEEVTFQLYRVISGQTVTAENLVGSFTADGKPDQNPVKLTYEDETAEKDQTIYVQEISSWNFKLTGLPEFDPEGREYEYILLEVTDENSYYYPTYTTTRDEDNNYHTRVVNGPGEGHRIMVQKSWYDDGDMMHREDIVVGVFVKDTHEQIATASLAGGVWQKQVGIGKYRPDEVYVLELQVGEKEVDRPEDENGEVVAPGEDTRIQYETSHHKYDVSYLGLVEIAGESFYTIVNRRLGNVNLTVTKNWIDGDGSRRKEIEEELERLKEEADVTLFPRIQLQFANEYGDAYKIGEYSEVGQEGGYVNIGGSDVPIRDDNDKPASSLQELSLATDSNSQELHFFNLPKYNDGGTVVNYTVKEVWVDSSGQVLTDSEIREKYPDLYQLISQYTTSIVQTSYEPSDLRDEDEQKITVTNRLGGTKDVTWHKQWEDEYNHQQGLRPDIYLDVYGVSSNPENPSEPKLVVENYRWTYADIPDDDEGNLDRYNSTRHWHAVISGLDQYDEDGYEIYYYAVEDTQVDPANFDYKPVAYYLENEESPSEPIYIGSETESVSEYENYVYDIANESETRYALREDGTFTNTISDVVTIRGQKIWSNLPGSYPSEDLPKVTFALAQKLGDQVVVEEYATVTVGGWDQLSTSGGAYSFSMAYKGENNSNGDYVGSGEDERLPRYDEHGNMYSYELYEKSIEWTNDVDLEEERVFDFATASNSYRIENIYRPATGSIAFDKILYIPKGDGGEPLAYPGVKFQVSRSYTKSSDGSSEPEIVEIQGEDELVWTSAEVKEDYLEASTSNADKGGPNWLRKTFTLENLPLYAPNGSDYVYTITEIKDDFMEGYDTWTAEGEVVSPPDSVEEHAFPGDWKQSADGEAPALTKLKAQEIADGAEPSVQGTFINQVRQGTVTLTGEKRWEDYDNHFGFRPDGPNDLTMNPVELTLYRSAPTQEEQENPIGLEPVPKESYTIEWSWDKSDNSKWTYTIEGVENSSELELYAPNGRLWQYTVRETLPKDSPYIVTPEAPEGTSEDGQAAQKQYIGGGVIRMNALTNSIMTSKSFRKRWVDVANEEIKEDYLGFNLSVTFKLQVAVLDDDGQITNGGWKDAAEFFLEDEKEKLWGTENYSFTQKIGPSPIDAAGWGAEQTFKNLPIVLQRGPENSKETLHLTYRVVESEISYGNQTITVKAVDGQGNQTYTYEFSSNGQNDNLLFAPAYAEGGSNNANTTWHVNQLRTSGITVEKNWVNDNKNAYHTRPMNEAGTRWETNFVIQRATASSASSMSEEAWKNVTDGEGSFLLLQITGEEGRDFGGGTVEGLPIQDAYGNTYYYRAVELEPDWNDDGNLDETEMIEDEGFYYQDTYKAEYEYNYEGGNTKVSNQLQTTRAEAVKRWNMPKSDKKNLPEVTMTLQYQNESGTWTDLASVTLNGSEDENPEKPYYESEPWKACWKDLPQVYPGSKVTEGKTRYRVIESNPDGYVQEGETQIATSSNAESQNNPGDNGLITTYTFINVPTTSLTVEKEWVVASEDQKQEVTVGLYRLVDGGTYVPVPDPVNPGQNWTKKLNEANRWKATFDKLPIYAPADGESGGAEYKYTVRETYIGEDAVDFNNWQTDDFYIYYEREELENGSLFMRIRNVQKIDLIVVKDWKDDDNRYHTRPNDLEISLKQKVDGEEKFHPIAGSITHTEWMKVGNQWTCRYQNLHYANPHGQVYEYQVTETVPDVVGALSDAGEKYTAVNNGIAIQKENGGFYLTNTLTDNTVELEITKNWIDGGDVDRLRPDEITVELYGNGVKVRDYTFNQGGNLLTDILEAVTGRNGDSWTCTIKELPEYDYEGKRIQYTIGEARIDGYKAQVVKQPDGEPDGNRYTAVLSNVLLTSLPVEKIWGGVASQDQEEVVVGLYQAAAKDNPQEESPKPYEDENGNQITLKLNETNGWQGEFTDLPRFNPAGSRYHYTAQELTVGGVTVDETGYIVEITNQPAGAQKATASIANIATTSIAGRKIWVDNSNAYGLRPESLTLKLYRSTGKGTEEQVSEEPKWTDHTGNNWDYCYENLPATDQKGDAYTYRVEEIVPDGYQAATSSNAKGGVDFTNTLSRRINISGTKTWRDGSSASRPEKIELILERQTDGNDGWSRINRTPQWSGQETDVWTYTFSDLEEFNSQGLRYTYRVREAKVPEGYDVYYSGNDIENVRKGALTVTKTVSGNRGETERQFHFTVTLSDASINGTFGSMTFKGGIAQFTLKHGETLRAIGLPGGISYTVTEQEDDQEGYSTTSTRAQGTIPEGGIAAVSFNNHRSRSGSSGNPSSDSDPTGSRAYTFTDGGPSVTSQTTTSNVTSTDATSTTTPPWPFEVVKTGDQSRLRRYLTMFMISLAGLVILLMIGLTKGRKKKK